MNKKEVLEIRKQFSPKNCAITRICGCYVDHEKNKKMESKEAFLSLPEEEAFKYFDIFKKTLSGSIGKNMINMEFPIDAEMPGGTQEFLLKLRDSRLEDDMLLEEFYDKVIATYEYAENYYIILIHAMYDIPGKSSDDMEMFDASDEVYQHILMSICPVSLSKAGLSYNAEENCIQDRIRDWIVDRPDKGFLFPAFNDRSTDIHNLLYYVKSTKEMYSEFITEALGCTETIPSADQKQMFKDIIEQAIVNQPDYEVVNVVRDINENLTEMIENHSGDEPVTLGKEEIKNLFQASGVKEEDLEKVDTRFADELGEDMRFNANDIQEKRKFEVKTNNVVINVKPEDSNIVKIKMIDGRKCLVIPMDNNVEINGIMSIIKEELEKNSEE